jgi:PKD repeat protein
MKRLKLAGFIMSLLFMASCGDSINETETKTLKSSEGFEIESTHDVSIKNDVFTFVITPEDTSNFIESEINCIHWDFDSDGIFEIECADFEPVSYGYEQEGVYKVTAIVNLNDKGETICTNNVFVMAAENILDENWPYTVHEMRYSANEEEIYFSSGAYPHNIFKVNSNGGKAEGVTTNLLNDKCRHYPIVSGDNKLLAYEYNDGISILNLETNNEFQLTDRSIFISSRDFTNDNSGLLAKIGEEIVVFDIETKESSVLLNNAGYFSALKDENKLAFINKVDNGYSLILYDYKEKAAIGEYQNIPFNGAFKYLKSIDAIYYTELHILYFLHSGKFYRIAADKIYKGWPSEISQDGRNILFSTSDKNLLKINMMNLIDQ